MRITVPIEGFTAPSFTMQRPGTAEEVTVHALPLLPVSDFKPSWSDDTTPTFHYDVEQLISSYSQPIPLDVDHATETAAPDTRARGWGYGFGTAETHPELDLKAGLLYGFFELNALGASELADRQYGFTSAVVLHDETGLITGIKSVAATNNPALRQYLPTMFSASAGAVGAADYTGHQQTSGVLMTLEELIALFKLPADSTEDAVKEYLTKVAEAQAASEEAAETKGGTGEGETASPAATAATADVDVAVAFSALQAEVAALKTAVAKREAAFAAVTAPRATRAVPTAAANPARTAAFTAFGLTAAEAAEADALGDSYALYAKNKRDAAAILGA